MLKELVLKYGIEKVNTLTKYPSILTLHKFGERGRFINDLTTNISPSDVLYASEKIDGTNVRIICIGNEYIIGSRNELLAYSGDLCFNPSQQIVENVAKLIEIPSFFEHLTIIYGELFGGKVSKNSKQYGDINEFGFRCFDIVTIENPEDLLNNDLEEISRFREHETEEGLEYGHKFMTIEVLQAQCHIANIPIVPSLKVDIADFSHQSVLDYLNKAIRKTNVALSERALMKPEGIILRNSDRSKIIKLRFEDYIRTLR